MIYGFTLVQVGVAVLAGVLCLGFGLVRRPPNDLTLGALALVELLLLAQVVIALLAPSLGNEPTGSPAEFWVYLVTAVLIPVASVLWALVERSRWSTIVLAIAAFAIAVMVYRMQQIWAVPLG